MEANPDSVTRQRASVWLASGVNRISLGVQALDDRLLASIGRIHDSKQAVEAYRSLRDAGCANVGMDFIWGLPGETRGQWRRQLEQAAALEPDHLSCYGLTLEEGTPLYDRQDSLAFPGEDDLAGMYLDTGEILAAHGYARYEISNHARPGRRCRHNMGYWNGTDYLGLGPAAVGTIGGVRRCSSSDLRTWAAEVAGGGPIGTEEHLAFRNRADEFIMLRLRTADGLSLAALRRICGRDPDEGVLSGLLDHGLAETDGNTLRLTAQGMLVSNSIISRIFEDVPEEDALPGEGGLPFTTCSAGGPAERNIA
ncbi:MAG: coproporphyrinogen III oxidase family protein, partial [Mailhella sp.]|nr:coproporphyrinogen III oxidase family protein [Mailhella sp.]